MRPGAVSTALAAAASVEGGPVRSIDANAVHGSDGPETARTEIAFFFPADEIYPR
mgnify:CR=1 FL=1